ncbi:MAG: hypothetical protein R2880_11130 [Deinococcales bacterium]
MNNSWLRKVVAMVNNGQFSGSSSPTLINVSFVNNSAVDGGDAQR